MTLYTMVMSKFSFLNSSHQFVCSTSDAALCAFGSQNNVHTKHTLEPVVVYRRTLLMALNCIDEYLPTASVLYSNQRKIEYYVLRPLVSNLILIFTLRAIKSSLHAMKSGSR